MIDPGRDPSKHNTAAGLPHGCHWLCQCFFRDGLLGFFRRTGKASGTRAPSDRGSRNGLHLVLLSLLALVSLPAAGCTGGREDTLDVDYGRRHGMFAARSVNGTAVLAGMYENQGYDVFSWPSLSPALDKADVIVWFPDDFNGPSEEVRDWLEDWLINEGRGGRTLIYVGRDYDAAPSYWKKVIPGAPADEVETLQNEESTAQFFFSQARAAIESPPVDYDWFTIDGRLAHRDVRSLAGPWSEDIDASLVEIELNGRIVIPRRWSSRQRVLLEAVSPGGKRDTLVSVDRSSRWRDSQLIVVANGSFLLNLPLVNHQHRRLAGRLIEETGQVSPSGLVVFLESGAGGPPIHPSDRAATKESPWNEPPFVYIIGNFVALAIVFILFRWPVFGRAKTNPPESRSDFGRHIEALGALLSLTRDRRYARSRIAQYQHTVRGDPLAENPRAADPPSGSEIGD